MTPVLLMPNTVAAGFPSPAAVFSASPLILDEWIRPARASTRLVQVPTCYRTFHVVDPGLQPIPGDRLWHPDAEALLEWPPASKQARELLHSEPGLIVRASIYVFRRREYPGPHPLSLHDWLLPASRPLACYFIRATGHSMVRYQINDGSLLVVDRSARLVDGDVVIVGCSSGFLVKRYRQCPPRLEAGNSGYPDIPLTADGDYQLDGVVIASCTRHRLNREKPGDSAA